MPYTKPEINIKEQSNEEIPCVALGNEPEIEIVEVNPDAEEKPKSMDDRIRLIEERQFSMINMLDNLFLVVKEMRDALNSKKDHQLRNIIETKKHSDKVIPEGTVLWGTSKGLSYFLTVKQGGFYVGDKRYESLSAAAEHVSE